MEVFEEFLAKIDNPQHLARVEEVLTWVPKKYPNLKPKIAWNQPMFTHHGTFIIGFSVFTIGCAKKEMLNSVPINAVKKIFTFILIGILQFLFH